MKVFTKVVIDIETGNVLESEHFDYDGPVSLCCFGGGGGDIEEAVNRLREAYERAASVSAWALKTAQYAQQPYYLAGTQALKNLAFALGVPEVYVPQLTQTTTTTTGGWRWPTSQYERALGMYGLEEPPKFTTVLQKETRPQDYSLTSTLSQWPGYQFITESGRKAIESAAAARGLGPGTGPLYKALMDWGQQSALRYALQPYLTMLSSLSGAGQAAAGAIGTSGLQGTQQIGSTLVSGAQAALQGTIEKARQEATEQAGFLGGIGTLLGLGIGALTGGLGGPLFSALGLTGSGAGSIINSALAAPATGAIVPVGIF